ncbi:hypothetical protein C9I56_32940 [Paraburkholderia caribensis]|nr:hypothetical protein C9I56_32940 [Paraburkholderia caribensis]
MLNSAARSLHVHRERVPATRTAARRASAKKITFHDGRRGKPAGYTIIECQKQQWSLPARIHTVVFYEAG